ncbi:MULTISPECIES: hypothetical protein [Actinosynnema]|uniref:hypothetical protein n=1 Tax=Actinosynnema TaxID=40566 RepID=UPI0020A5A1C9|nr:hypothetical protein [Actinosynnema pretiosum]MCP2094590.1 hypothetical protein [Actinosynnema pretiosum]
MADPGQFFSRYEEQFARAQRAEAADGEPVATFRVVVSSADGEIAVTVDDSGHLVDLKLGESLRHHDGAAVAAEVLRLLQAVRATSDVVPERVKPSAQSREGAGRFSGQVLEPVGEPVREPVEQFPTPQVVAPQFPTPSVVQPPAPARPVPVQAPSADPFHDGDHPRPAGHLRPADPPRKGGHLRPVDQPLPVEPARPAGHHRPVDPSRPVEPHRQAEPRHTEPRRTAPRPVDPGPTEPRPVEPRPVEPGPAEPHREPRAADPSPSDDGKPRMPLFPPPATPRRTP